MKFVILLCMLTTSTIAQSNYGTEFYVGGMRNLQGTAHNFLLYVMTPSSTPVFYTVETYSSVLYTGSVTNTVLAKRSLSTSLIVTDSSYYYRNKGIRVFSNDGGLLSVFVVNQHQDGSIGSYLAYSVQDQKLDNYIYYAVSTGTAGSSYSEALLVGIHDNTTVTIVPTQNMTVPQDIQDPSSMSMTVTAGTAFNVTLHKMQTFYIGAVKYDISGTSITSDKLITVITGHECANVPVGEIACEHIAVQVPHKAGWGTEHLISSFNLIKIQFYKIIAGEEQTTCYFTCGQGNVSTHILADAGSVLELTADENDNCSLVSDKPVLVMKIGPSHSVSGIGDPIMSVVPPTTIYFKSAAYVFLPDNLFPSGTGYSSHNINIISKRQVNITVDGMEVQQLEWNPIYDRNSIIGYNAQMPSGSLDRAHYIESNDTMSILVYGLHSLGSGYSYSASIGEICAHDNGGCEHICNSSVDPFVCSCFTGYILDNNDRNCTDINECLVNNGNCEHNCINQSPSYNCSCRSGFMLYNQSFCSDINECLNITGNCTCNNTVGSFNCSCPSGYQLNSSDNQTCLAIPLETADDISSFMYIYILPAIGAPVITVTAATVIITIAIFILCKKKIAQNKVIP